MPLSILKCCQKLVCPLQRCFSLADRRRPLKHWLWFLRCRRFRRQVQQEGLEVKGASEGVKSKQRIAAGRRRVSLLV